MIYRSVIFAKWYIFEGGGNFINIYRAQEDNIFPSSYIVNKNKFICFVFILEMFTMVSLLSKYLSSMF